MKILSVIAIVVFILSSCKPAPKSEGILLESISQSDKQWTGIAVSKEGRIFVNYPNWSSSVPVSVAEIINGIPRSYPNMTWNQRRDTLSFHSIQSVYIDKLDRLWILDTNNPQFSGVLKQGPILYQFNVEADTLVNAFSFDQSCYQAESYFNDVRVDTEKNIAYLTDSGDGAIIVLDLNTKLSRRLLDDHSSTLSEENHLFCDGIKWKNTVHSDGIALTPDNSYLYYAALTGHTLYRIKTEHLLNKTLNKKELQQKVEKVMKIPATDGMLFDDEGNLYLGGLEDNSINRINKDGVLEKYMQNPQIRWSDSFAKDVDGNIYFTTSQIHLPENKREQYEVIRFNPESTNN